MYWDQVQIDSINKRLDDFEKYVSRIIDEPMTATEVKIRHLLQIIESNFNNSLEVIHNRINTCEKVFIKIMQLDVRLLTLEFDSGKPVMPSAAEKLMDMQLRLERLESYLLNGEK